MLAPFPAPVELGPAPFSSKFSPACNKPPNRLGEKLVDIGELTLGSSKLLLPKDDEARSISGRSWSSDLSWAPALGRMEAKGNTCSSNTTSRETYMWPSPGSRHLKPLCNGL